MTLNRVKLERAVTFMTYLGSVAPLIFLAKASIWNKIKLPPSNLLNLAGMVVNKPMKCFYKKNYQYFFFCSIYR